MAVQRRQCCVPLRRLAARGVPGEGAPLAAERSGRPSRVCRSVCPKSAVRGGAAEAAALVLATQEFVANGGGRRQIGAARVCIAGADGQPWPSRWAWLVAFHCDPI